MNKNIVKKYMVSAENSLKSNIKNITDMIGVDVSKEEFTDDTAKLWVKEDDSNARDLNIDLKKEFDDLGYEVAVTKTGNLRIFTIKVQEKINLAASTGDTMDRMLTELNGKYITAERRGRTRSNPNYGKKSKGSGGNIYDNLLNRQSKIQDDLDKLLDEYKKNLEEMRKQPVVGEKLDWKKFGTKKGRISKEDLERKSSFYKKAIESYELKQEAIEETLVTLKEWLSEIGPSAAHPESNRDLAVEVKEAEQDLDQTKNDILFAKNLLDDLASRYNLGKDEEDEIKKDAERIANELLEVKEDEKDIEELKEKLAS